MECLALPKLNQPDPATRRDRSGQNAVTRPSLPPRVPRRVHGRRGRSVPQRRRGFDRGRTPEIADRDIPSRTRALEQPTSLWQLQPEALIRWASTWADITISRSSASWIHRANKSTGIDGPESHGRDKFPGIVNVAERFKPYIYVDATGIGDAIFEQLKGKGLSIEPFVFTNASKTQLMDHLASQLENGSIRLMDIPVQEGELINYEYRLTPSRNVIMSAPEGEFDDCVCALALAA